MEMVKINETDLQVKMWNGQRVVTLADIDRVHERVEGTAKRNFNENKSHLLENEDYYMIKGEELKKLKQSTKFVLSNARSIILLTESGYLLLVKSFTDDLAWKVQRDLVNTYFKFQEVVQSMEPTETGLILPNEEFSKALDTLTNCAVAFQSMMEYSTINYKQQQELLQTARKRINHLLGGAHSPQYKEWSRIYFKNLWLNFADHFKCGTYKDLNPVHMKSAKEYLQNWTYE